MSALARATEELLADRDEHADWQAATLRIAFINNMPPAAVAATERQFLHLLTQAAGGVPLQVRHYVLPGIARAPAATHELGPGPAEFASLFQAAPDVVVVTGAEPAAAQLRDEPFWHALAEVLDWAAQNGIAMLLSCLAAHAAALHFDGIPRTRLPSKRCGVFSHVGADAHAITRDLPRTLRIAHSRWNELREADLIDCGYRVLTRSADAGVEMFMRRRDSLTLFCQGHPEYEPLTLLREYRRDVNRYLRRERDRYPDLPQFYLDDVATSAALAFREHAECDRDAGAISAFPHELLARHVDASWYLAATPLFRQWLASVLERKTQRIA